MPNSGSGLTIAGVPPLIFTSEFLASVHPEPQMSDPLSHQVARRSLYQRHRDRLERWAADYPECSRNQLVGRLRAKKDEQHEVAVMELALHRMLSTHLGFDKVVPGPEIQEKTPDFRVVAGKTTFIVELQTVMEDPEDRKADRRRAELAEQINACAPPMTVALHFDPATADEPADCVSEGAAPAKIARLLASEVSSNAPARRSLTTSPKEPGARARIAFTTIESPPVPPEKSASIWRSRWLGVMWTKPLSHPHWPYSIPSLPFSGA